MVRSPLLKVGYSKFLPEKCTGRNDMMLIGTILFLAEIVILTTRQSQR